jgi:parallel beta helix pectate lyase-like protein
MKSWPKYALTIFATVLASNAAFGAAGRTFVASYGVDANTSALCGPAAPCRTFNAALSVTDAGGEVVVLDSASYGQAPIRITRSVSITAADWVHAEVTVPAGVNGIEISGSGISVALKGLTIENVGGNDGLRMTSGASLLIENCTIVGNAGTAASGIYTNGPIAVRIVNSTIRDGYDGISLVNGATATIKGVRLLNNSNIGLNVQGESAGVPTTVSVADTVANGGTIGFYAESLVRGAVARLSIDRSVASGNSTGIESSNDIPDYAAGTVNVAVSNSLISDNGYGLRAVGTSATMYLNASTVANSATCGISMTPPNVIYSYGNNAFSNSRNCGKDMTAVSLL